MPVNITCPNCQKTLRLPENLMGKRVRCPGCQEVFTAEDPEAGVEPVEEQEEEAIQEERPSRPARRRRREREEDEDYEDEPRRAHGRPHRGGVILTLGILTLALGCLCVFLNWILGGIAISMANADLAAMAQGKMDRSGQGMTNTGKILAIVGLILWTVLWVLSIILRFAVLNR